jgi:biopolymer transport protein ExbB/TolQ
VTNDVEHAMFRVAQALEVPVLVLALAALGLVLVELGAFAVELLRRRRRDRGRIERAAGQARAALERSEREAATAALLTVSTSRAMDAAIGELCACSGQPLEGERMAKVLADFDYRSLRRLERTRLLVRAGPALGLMGTLIPLSPALAALARGDVKELSDNLRVAFSVTVVGLLIGALAFGVSLVRDRLYGQDLSDLQYIAALIGEPEPGLRPSAAAAEAAYG